MRITTLIRSLEFYLNDLKNKIEFTDDIEVAFDMVEHSFNALKEEVIIKLGKMEKQEMKKSIEFRQLQQLVMTKQKRGLKLNSGLETLMAGYIEKSRLSRNELDEVAYYIEKEIEKKNMILEGEE